MVQTKSFTPSPSHLATDSQSVRFSVNIFSWDFLAAGARKYFFSNGPETALSGLGLKCVWRNGSKVSLFLNLGISWG
jgi:hypothetical protein